MPKLLPDQSFYPSPAMAMQAPVETLAYVALLNPDPTASDALAVLDVDPGSSGYQSEIARVNMPGAGADTNGACDAAATFEIFCSIAMSSALRSNS